MKKILITLLLILSLSPVRALAADAPVLDYSGFVKCDGVVERNFDPVTKAPIGLKPGEEKRDQECHFAQLMQTILGIVNWMFVISISVATVLFAYAGLLYITGKEKNITTAKGIFTSVAIGFIIMLTAWILVRTAINWIVDPKSGATTFIQ